MFKKNQQEQQEQQIKKKGGLLKKLGIGLLVLVVLGVIFGDGDDTEQPAQPVAQSGTNEPVEKQEEPVVIEEEETGNLSDEDFQKLDDDVSVWTTEQGQVSLKQVEDYIKTKNLTDDDYNKIVSIMKDGIDFDTQAFYAYGGLVEEGMTEDEAKTEMSKRGYTEENINYALENYTPPVSKEFQNALKKAESYAKTMHMSKKAIYNQLTSEYGEGFPEDAAQYAVDALVWDYNENAYEKAKSYQDTMSMSLNNIKDQLTSEYGEQFTAEEAEYAINKISSEE